MTGRSLRSRRKASSRTVSFGRDSKVHARQRLATRSVGATATETRQVAKRAASSGVRAGLTRTARRFS